MDWLISKRKFEAQRQAETAGQVADSMEVRMAIMARFHAGEITLDAAKAEIERIKRGAKKAGKITRDQAFRRG